MWDINIKNGSSSHATIGQDFRMSFNIENKINQRA